MDIAVILSGCGVFDGAEIHEATLSLYQLAKHGFSYTIFAPDIKQTHVINHISGEEMPEERNVLIEASRIARGNIKPLSEFNPDDFIALFIPGGFGVAKNLSNLAFKGKDLTVNKEFANAVKSIHSQKKPIVALCISPAVIAKVLKGVSLTTGNDEGTNSIIESFGNKAVTINSPSETFVDKINQIITSPCYMLDASIAEIGDAAENAVFELKRMLE